MLVLTCGTNTATPNKKGGGKEKKESLVWVFALIDHDYKLKYMKKKIGDTQQLSIGLWRKVTFYRKFYLYFLQTFMMVSGISLNSQMQNMCSAVELHSMPTEIIFTEIENLHFEMQ